MKKTIQRKRNLILLLATLSVTHVWGQQDAQFSQYMFHGLYVNPAYAGYRGVWNLNAGYRNQWAGFSGAPKTVSAALDGMTHNDRVGLGLHITSDKIGAKSTNVVYATYAYRFPIDTRNESRRLALGMSLGLVQESLHKDKIYDVDPEVDNKKANMFIPDARFGIYYSTDRFYAGVSADNLLTHGFMQKKNLSKAFMDRKLHTYITVGGLIPLSDDLSLKPSLLIKDDLAGPTSGDFSSFLLIQQKIWVGGTYRRALNLYKKDYLARDLKKSDVLVGLIEAHISDNLRLGVSYDHMLNSTAMRQFSTYEVSVGYYLVSPKTRMLSPRNF